MEMAFLLFCAEKKRKDFSMSVTFSISLAATNHSSDTLQRIQELQEQCQQNLCDILQRLNQLEEQNLQESEEFASLMEHLENAEPSNGLAFYELQMSTLNFVFLNNLLALPTDEGNTGRISAENLLLKIAHARQVILAPGGKEWERSEEPPSVEGSLKLLATPGLGREEIESYLQQLRRIAEFAYANLAEVIWS